MKTLRTREIVDLIVGRVHPVGETTEDGYRFDNLKELIQLTDSLLTTIEQVAEMRNYKEFSVKRAAEFAYEYRNRLTEYEE